MKLSIALFVASAAVAAAVAIPSPQDDGTTPPTTEIPDCVNTCIVPPMWDTDCRIGDVADADAYMNCICADADLKKGARECLPATCARDEIPAALSIINTSCEGREGYPVTEEELFPAAA